MRYRVDMVVDKEEVPHISRAATRLIDALNFSLIDDLAPGDDRSGRICFSLWADTEGDALARAKEIYRACREDAGLPEAPADVATVTSTVQGTVARVWDKVAWRLERIQEKLGRTLFERGQSDTSGRIPLARFNLAAPNRVNYLPSGWLVDRRVLRGVPVREADVFIDVGCGKGRVVSLVARHHRFGRVIGVELVPELAQIAEQNIERVRGKLKSRQVEIIVADALQYEIPDDVTHAYFFNPFRGEIFQQVLANLIDSLDRNPRRMFLLYLNPEMHEDVMATGRFKLLRTSRGFVRRRNLDRLHVYESLPVPERVRPPAREPEAATGRFRREPAREPAEQPRT